MLRPRLLVLYRLFGIERRDGKRRRCQRGRWGFAVSAWLRWSRLRRPCWLSGRRLAAGFSAGRIPLRYLSAAGFRRTPSASYPVGWEAW